MHPVRLGPYVIDRKIGAGGMGNVYLGKHGETGQVAAIKELPASLAREEGFVLRFNREIEAMRKLDNPHIVKLFEAGTDNDETYFYAMEYVEGETLTALLRRERRIPWKETIRLGIQMCAGLKHAHDSGVVHRDLKPSNLLLDKVGNLKLTDFGVAQVFAADRLTMTGAILGTAEIMQKQRFGRFDPPRNYVPEIPSWLDDIVCQLLEKDPEKRLPDAFVVSKRLNEVLRKMELKQSVVVAQSSPDSETRADIPLAPQRAIGATFMRDFMKAQLSEQEPDSLWERFFNNTWVLIGLLMMVLVGIVLFWPDDSDRRTQQSRAISEPERIVQIARSRKKGGDLAGAKQLLDALRPLIDNDERHLSTLRAVDSLLASIRDQRASNPRAFIREALDRAAKLEVEEPEQAKTIWLGIMDLYDNDSALRELVEEARRKLEVSRTSDPKAGSEERLD